jgi:hypothetical protein
MEETQHLLGQAVVSFGEGDFDQSGDSGHFYLHHELFSSAVGCLFNHQKGDSKLLVGVYFLDFAPECIREKLCIDVI